MNKDNEQPRGARLTTEDGQFVADIEPIEPDSLRRPRYEVGTVMKLETSEIILILVVKEVHYK
jgi:hypothetical protein